MSRSGFLQAAKLKVYGVGFLAVVAGLLTLTILIYNKTFTPTVPVTLEADRIGNQLTVPADVKLRGILVGEVRSVRTTGGTAKLTLALDPGKVDLIPANVKARIAPKTLFGEKFVDLQIPQDPSGRHIAAGDVIPQDRSETAIELATVFDDLLPLLNTLEPQKVMSTLNAIATSLRGQGAELGGSLVRSDTYLASLNPNLPNIQADISGLADLADSLGDAAPDLLRLASNQAVTSTTLVEKNDALAGFLRGTAGFADTFRGFLTDNENRLIALADTSRPILETLATYSNVFPCLARGLAEQEPTIEGTFRSLPGEDRKGHYLHIKLEVVPDRGSYDARADKPRYDTYARPEATSTGNGDPAVVDPSNRKQLCAGLPYPGEPKPGAAAPSPSATQGRAIDGLLGFGDIGPVGSADEQSIVGAVAASVLGEPVDAVPGVATVVLGPVFRGTEVSVQ